MKKFLVLLAMVSVLFVSCQKKEAAAPEAKVEEKKEEIVIGALIRNTDEQFVADYADVLKGLAADAGVTLKLQDSRGDMAAQLDQMNTLLVQGVKHFVVVANVSEATEDMAKAIHAKGGSAAFSNIQPSVEALKVGPNFFLASSPETVAGTFQAQILDEYFTANPEKMANGDPDAIDAVFIYGQLGHPAQVYRTNAVKQGLIDAGYKLNVVAEDTANWKPSEAQSKMDAWISAYGGEFDVVIANNDGMALGAVESLITNGYMDDPNDPTKDIDGDGLVLSIPVVGVDATQVAVKAMDEKKLLGTVLQDAVGQATTAFELAMMMATEGSAAGKSAWGIAPLTAPIAEAPANDAAIVGQCYLVPFKAVTMSNYKEFMQ
ncbi:MULTISPECIES: substrate-binding domain-containing protein [unclassified Oceanispirochaeta]|uniref:substrate-binding domain-containing protein n=1 Tax=unclassified Oceanispirochaeta TaxID=2635722 RepID=UPI000E08D7A9|nr:MULTISPECIES: substrate-binding domain-containing protein [unclassified Oceanispirochaeta]MBF9014560.1 substrate-binding domain-containing protein [Oceanispirochaeta sp. M2]NPD70816.1 substrate-binding domain-containing protein [Oceanispirochaeta sp. M1]RDG34098.1 galactose-binding protein [Oceanispirochaeta sp. M1]